MTGCFAALTGADAYRAHQFDNPDAFVSMLGMYKVKALYVGLVQAFAGQFGEIGAIRLITTVSTAVTGTVFLLWLYRRQALAFAPFIIGLLMIGGYGDVARLGTPDAFFMALLSLGLFLHDRGKVWLGALALIMATLVRSDTIVFLAAGRCSAWCSTSGNGRWLPPSLSRLPPIRLLPLGRPSRLLAALCLLHHRTGADHDGF